MERPRAIAIRGLRHTRPPSNPRWMPARRGRRSIAPHLAHGAVSRLTGIRDIPLRHQRLARRAGGEALARDLGGVAEWAAAHGRRPGARPAGAGGDGSGDPWEKLRASATWRCRTATSGETSARFFPFRCADQAGCGHRRTMTRHSTTTMAYGRASRGEAPAGPATDGTSRALRPCRQEGSVLTTGKRPGPALRDGDRVTQRD
jgi:hypothetical protein